MLVRVDDCQQGRVASCLYESTTVSRVGSRRASTNTHRRYCDNHEDGSHGYFGVTLVALVFDNSSRWS